MLTNGSSATVSNATISISSGYDPSLFEVAPSVFDQPPTSELPSSCSVASLVPGGQAQIGLSAPGVDDALSLGFDSATSASPLVLPAGGGQTTEQVAVTVTDPRFAGGGIQVNTGTPDLTFVSQSVPQNLDQGESVTTDGQDWNLSHLQLNKQYIFQAVVDVTNPAGTGPTVFSPSADVTVTSSVCGPPCGHQSAPSSMATIPDAVLEGAFVFAVDQPGTWTLFHKTFYGVYYQENQSQLAASQCKKGGWQSYGIFRNQGDCVSYVATGGKNPPGSP